MAAWSRMAVSLVARCDAAELAIREEIDEAFCQDKQTCLHEIAVAYSKLSRRDTVTAAVGGSRSPILTGSRFQPDLILGNGPLWSRLNGSPRQLPVVRPGQTVAMPSTAAVAGAAAETSEAAAGRPHPGGDCGSESEHREGMVMVRTVFGTKKWVPAGGHFLGPAAPMRHAPATMFLRVTVTVAAAPSLHDDCKGHSEGLATGGVASSFQRCETY